MKKDVIITFAAQFFILITGILVYKFAAVFFGKTGFAEYALCRRTMVLILPAILLSLDVGISRYIAFSGSDPRVSARAVPPSLRSVGGGRLASSCRRPVSHRVPHLIMPMM